MFRSFAPDDCATANDLSATFAYNPASQITANVSTGDSYAWTQHFNQNVAGTPNGLSQLTAVGPKTLTHDTKGNVTAFGTKSFTYSSENLLLTGPSSTTLSYDGMMRLRRVVAGGTTVNLVYDGLDRIAEVSSSVVQRRYVHGPGVDEPLVWYEGSGTTDRRFLSADERGSIVSVTSSTGAMLGINRYDEYGQPQSTNLGVWGYTGQAWLPSLGAWYYKARVYEPELGRFLQPDPIGYAGSVNLYVYVSAEPVNLFDPLGTECRKVTGSLVRYCGDEEIANAYLMLGYVVAIPTVAKGEEDAGGISRLDPSLEACRNGKTSFCLNLAQKGSTWTTADFLQHYFTGQGSTVNLADVGLGSVFENHPSVRGATDAFEWRVIRFGTEPFFTVRDIGTTDVTDSIFAVGRSALFEFAYCMPTRCSFSFEIRDAFQNPTGFGIEPGGTPYGIYYRWNETRSRPPRPR